jgi:hypothetical protein
MADKGSKTKREPESVLGSLPAKRPERLGRPRREVTVAKVQPTGPRPAKAKPAPAAKRARSAPAAKTARAGRIAPAAKPVAKRGPNGAKRELPHGPAAVTAGAPPLERPRSSEPPPKPIGPPKGTEIVTTAIQASGELARIGLTVGGQLLKRAVDRLPRP